MATRTSSNVIMRCAAAFALVPIAMAWGCTYRSGFDLEGVDAQAPLRAIGAVGVANVRTTSVDLVWASASGGLAPKSELYYQVYFSTNLPLGTVNEAHAGTRFGIALVGVTGVTVTGLVPATRYRFNTIVSDGKGNEAAYEAASATTLDATPATGAVLVSNVSRNQVELSWPKATDDQTPQSELIYQAYYSTHAPFDTLSEVRAGTAVGSPAKDIAGVTVTGLAGATTYSFNVVVTDTDGLSSTYVAGLAKTAANPAVAITAPPANSYANAANASSFAVSGTCSEEGRTVADPGQRPDRRPRSRLGALPPATRLASNDLDDEARQRVQATIRKHSGELANLTLLRLARHPQRLLGQRPRRRCSSRSAECAQVAGPTNYES